MQQCLSALIIMRCQVLLMALLVVCSLGLAGYIHNKRKEELKLAKHASFQNVKNRVTKDVLKEYQNQAVETSNLLDSTKKQLNDLKAELTAAQVAADTKKAAADTCTGDLKRITDEIAAIDTQKANTEGEFQKKKASLQEQIANLKKASEERSKMCDYLKADSADGWKLCGIPNPPNVNPEEKKEEAKVEKKEETKEEKKEEAKVEKKEEAKEEKADEKKEPAKAA
uniref:Zgc:174935 n=1 Tax=Astyanax mexicanus TaxID=7994 RepID=A0A3B1K8L4_ASTMX